MAATNQHISLNLCLQLTAVSHTLSNSASICYYIQYDLFDRVYTYASSVDLHRLNSLASHFLIHLLNNYIHSIHFNLIVSSKNELKEVCLTQRYISLQHYIFFLHSTCSTSRSKKEVLYNTLNIFFNCLNKIPEELGLTKSV